MKGRALGICWKVPIAFVASVLATSPLVAQALSSNPRYVSSGAPGGGPMVLVGVSADNACHFNFTGKGQCNYGAKGANFKPFLDDLAAQGLNVMRLWVSIVGGNTKGSPNSTRCKGVPPMTPPGDPKNTDTPFLYDAAHRKNGVGRWWLDSKNADYFERLAAVVSYANSKNIFVEVTLFSPLTGDIGIGPYGVGHAYTSDNKPLRGFTDTANFTDLASIEFVAMKPYLWNVIHWTVDALYTFPNVYFEVANEPENVRLSAKGSHGCGDSSEEALDSTAVSAWQSAIATELRAYETMKYVAPNGPLARPHLVAVEPSTTFGAAAFVGGAYAASADVVNSHYTVINPSPEKSNPLTKAGLGAIRMVRLYPNQPKIFGFNETKITGGNCAGANTGGSVSGGRAEAWEFLLNQGGIYDAYGYDCSGIHDCGQAANAGDPYCQIRMQMGVLRRFLADRQVDVVTSLRTSISLPTGAPWINVGAYETPEPPPPAAPTSFKFWAALAPTIDAADKRWLVYIHHSKPSPTVHGGYLDVTVPNGYRETNLSVCLLGAPEGTYKVRWYQNPESAVASAPSRTDTIVWPAPAACTPGGANAIALPQSDDFDYSYDYDLAILISK